jgi:hypothetical protein
LKRDRPQQGVLCGRFLRRIVRFLWRIVQERVPGMVSGYL